MRNIFDQYSQVENRVTHALASSLASDGALLRRFVAWATGGKAPPGQLEILEQSLPGERLDLSEEESERRGLPDACILAPGGWALIIESKVAAKVNTDQLRRHLRTAERRGLTDCHLLLLTAATSGRSGGRVIARTWTDVYRWLILQTPESRWAGICANYLEVAEARGAADGYLKEGALTVFSGIPFDAENPYTYAQGKRILGLLRGELLKHKGLQRKLHINAECQGRGAITGSKANRVWDFISLVVPTSGGKVQKAVAFTKQPHLTLGIGSDAFGISLTLPNSVPARFRNGVLGADRRHFEELIAEATQGITKVLRASRGAVPRITVVQRHYLTQRSLPTVDASLQFDPRTAVYGGSRRSRTRTQPEWLQATYEALRSRRSNLQFQIGAEFPYAKCPEVRTAEICDLAAGVWLACRPIIKAATAVTGD